jgi:hypothetical protein
MRIGILKEEIGIYFAVSCLRQQFIARRTFHTHANNPLSLLITLKPGFVHVSHELRFDV